MAVHYNYRERSWYHYVNWRGCIVTGVALGSAVSGFWFLAIALRAFW